MGLKLVEIDSAPITKEVAQMKALDEQKPGSPSDS